MIKGTNIQLEKQSANQLGGKKIIDPNEHTLILQCSIPSAAIHPNATIIHVLFGEFITKIFIRRNFGLVLGNDEKNAVNISICRSYESSFDFINSRIYLDNETELILGNNTTNNLAACTQTSHGDFNFPLWINYHYKMGINHFYIYDHAPFNQTILHKTLKSYVDYNIITIVPWHVDYWKGFETHGSPSEWISHQIWSQNDCIHRYGHLYSWMLIEDVDEFVLPMGEFRDFTQMLNEVSTNYCALQVLNYDFRALWNDTSVTETNRPSMLFVFDVILENLLNFFRKKYIS